jgi:uncharacterized protein (TIGR02996 family)
VRVLRKRTGQVLHPPSRLALVPQVRGAARQQRLGIDRRLLNARAPVGPDLRDHPAADAPRLVSADWLDEQGRRRNPIRRVQVNKIGGALERIVASPGLARVSALCLYGDLGKQDVGARGASLLARSPHLANLTALELPYCEIGSDGLRALADSPHLTKLEALNLYCCDRRGDAARAGQRLALRRVDRPGVRGEPPSDRGLRAARQHPSPGQPADAQPVDERPR